MLKNKNNTLLKKITPWICVAAILILTLVCVYFIQTHQNKLSKEITVSQAQEILESNLDNLPNVVATGTKAIFDNSSVKINNMTYGNEKNLILECSYSTFDVKGVIENNLNDYLSSAYELYLFNNEAGKKTNATKIKLHITEQFKEDIENAKPINGNITLEFFETSPGVFELYLEDNAINTIFGGIIDVQNIIKNATTIEYKGQTVSIETLNTLRTGIKDCIALRNYSNQKPNTSIALVKAWNTFKFDFHRNFIYNNQWKYITNGLITTLEITFLAVLLGIVIGFVVAIIRVTNQKTGNLAILSGICKVYLSVMRGTPVMVQLLIVYFVILLPIGVEKFPAAVLCFGLNSGAYVSEIIRGGINSIDNGQTEAGRSLGLNYMQTMTYIIIPQAFKAVLPSLANEFIALLKESSVAFYIGVADLTLGGIKIRSITYSNFMPLIAVAIVYLIVVLGLTKCVGILERRLNKSDNR